MEFLPLNYSLLYFFCFWVGGELEGEQNKSRARACVHSQKKEENLLLCEPTQSRRGDKTPWREVLGVLRKLNWDFRASDAVSRVLSVSVDTAHEFTFYPPCLLWKV